MKKGLTIGEVSKLLNIPCETLRYFDKEGIVKAQKGQNNYRYYDDWDINYLIEYKRYRGLGFSMPQTKDILYQDSLDSLKDQCAEQREELRQKMIYYELLLKRTDSYIFKLEDIKDRVDKYRIVDTAPMKYFAIRYNNEYLCRPDISYLMKEWSDALPFVDPILLIQKPYQADYECGLSITDEYFDYFQLPTNHLVETREVSRAVNTIIVAGERNTFSTELLVPVYHYIEENQCTVNGPVIGYYLARVHEPDGYKRYIEVYIPIE